MKDFENCSETVLIRRARRGDIQAFGVLYGRIYKELYRFALYTMRHKQDAEDVVSETVVAAYEGIDRLKKEEFPKLDLYDPGESMQKAFFTKRRDGGTE